MNHVIKLVFQTTKAKKNRVAGYKKKIYRWVWDAICGVGTVVSGIPFKQEGLITYGKLFGVPDEWRYGI